MKAPGQVADPTVPLPAGFTHLQDKGYRAYQYGHTINMRGPGLSTHISEYLWKISKSFSVYRLDHKHPKHYWFYHENYDEKKGEWKTSKEWMMDDPLKAAKLL